MKYHCPIISFNHNEKGRHYLATALEREKKRCSTGTSQSRSSTDTSLRYLYSVFYFLASLMRELGRGGTRLPWTAAGSQRPRSSKHMILLYGTVETYRDSASTGLSKVVV